MQEKSVAPTHSEPGTVLVVDDELKNRELLRDLLEVRGHRVIEAEDGEGALAAARNDRPDVILLDVMMPGMNGFDVCRRLKADPATAPIPVLLVTALQEREDRIAGIDAGANDFLTKPIDPQDVVLRTRNAALTKKLYDRVQEQYEKLRELEGLRDNLVHMIVHDLRSPLTGIMGFLQLLQLDSGDRLTAEDTAYVDTALSGCSTLLEMISSLLDVNRLEAGEMPLKLVECDLESVVDDAVGALRASVKAVRLVVDKPAESRPVVCDQELVRRIVTNLVSNAARASPDGAEVTTAIEHLPEKTRVSVRDRGPGIPPDYHDRVFEKFGQVEARSDGRKYSTGLGLTFCKLAVEAHRGGMGLDSRVGEGSTFWFELPWSA